MLRNILASSRYLLVIAVIGSFLTSITLLIYGGLSVGSMIIEVFVHRAFTSDEFKHLAVEDIELIDLFLLGAVLYIIALGLYELFIDEKLPAPRWLQVSSLDDLKAILIGVVIVLLAVTFLGNVVAWDGSANILALGIAVGLVLFALAYLVGLGSRHHQAEPNEQPKEE
ncbi:MAG: YqhA family protein [Ktedonobacteraceae bacterium]